MGESPPDPTAGQLMCPSHGKLCKKGICSGMSRLVKEEGKKTLRGGEVVVGEVGFVRLLAFCFTARVSLIISSALCSFVKTLLHAAYILFRRHWAQELCELKCEMETYIPTRFHLIQTSVLANFIAPRPNRVLRTEVLS